MHSGSDHPNVSRSGSYLQIYSESASYLSNLDRSDPIKVILDSDSMFHVVFLGLLQILPSESRQIRKDLFQILIQPSPLSLGLN
jgi:hypothetical protein